jgi:hypothetical protein
LSSENRYVLPEGTPRDPDAPGGREIVEDLADRIAELRADGVAADAIEPGHARALLAAHMELDRVSSELWRSVADPADDEWLQGVVREHGAALAAAAGAGWDRAGWLAAAERLEACYFAENLPEPTERAALARELLEELDEVELAAVAVERITGEPSGLADEATRSAAWVAEHPDTFLAAGTFVRAMGESIRPDLLEHDPDLALTAEKFVRVLEVLQEAEAVVTLADVASVATSSVSLAASVRRWWATLARAARELLSWRPEWPDAEPVLAQGAAAGEQDGPRVDLRGPEGRWQAMIRLPPRGAVPETPVTLWVRPWPEGLESGIICGLPARPERHSDGAKFVLSAGDMQRGWKTSALPVALLVFADGRFEAAEVVRDPVSK